MQVASPALYRGKQAGRDRVEPADSEDPARDGTDAAGVARAGVG